MFVFNFLFVICGLVLIIVGALVTKKDYTIFMDSKYVTAPTILIVVGVVIFLVAFLGCCGAVKENHCMVMTFGLLLFVIFVVELAGGISAYVYKSDVKTFLKDNMLNTIKQNKSDANIIWDEMQTKWRCCGVEGFKDYTDNNRTIPKSCDCQVGTDHCKNEIYDQGCLEQMKTKIMNVIGIVGGVAIGLGVVELLGCMFAWCLASAIKRDYEGV